MQSVTTNSRSVFWICVVLISYCFLYFFSGVSFPFIVGLILAYLCVPVVDTLSRYINRTLVSIMFAFFAVLIFIIIGIEVIPRLKEHLILLNKMLPEYYTKFVTSMNNIFSSMGIDYNVGGIDNLRYEMHKYLDQKIYIFASIIEKIASRSDSIRNFFTFFVVMPVSFFYFLRDWHLMIKYIYGCIPYRHKNTFIEITIIIRKTLRNFFHGQFYVVTTLSAYYSATLSIVGVEHNVIIGIISGMFSFIPLIGALLSFLLVIFIAAPILTFSKLYIIILVYFVGQFFEGYVLYPKFVGKKTGLHPLWILFSFFAGAQLYGIIGILIAIPFAAVAKNIIGFVIAKFKMTLEYKQ